MKELQEGLKKYLFSVSRVANGFADCSVIKSFKKH